MNLLDDNDDDRFELLGEIVEQSPLGRSARVNDSSTHLTEAEIPAADEDAGDCSSRGSRRLDVRSSKDDFERWAELEDHSISRRGDSYACRDTQIAWEAWQASAEKSAETHQTENDRLVAAMRKMK